MEKGFKCKFKHCVKTCKSKRTLEYHHRRHSRSRILRCDFCPKVYDCKQQLTIHRNSHLGIKPFACHLCPKKFYQRPHLTSHLRIHTGDKPFKCKLCPKQFTQSSHLRTHHLHHTGEKPYVCKVCNDSFRLSSTLKCHMRRHTGEKPYKCQEAGCGMQFSQTSPLYHHLATEHSNSVPYQCKFCGKGFRFKQFWKDHQNRRYCTRGVARRYSCVFCDRGGGFGKKYPVFKFHTEKELEHHLRLHTGERPYFCKYCDLTFINTKTRTYHMRIHLNNPATSGGDSEVEKSFHCQLCHHSFSNQVRLDMHVKQNHSPAEEVRSKKGDENKSVIEVVPVERKVDSLEHERFIQKRLEYFKNRSKYQTYMKMTKIIEKKKKKQPFNCDLCWSFFQTEFGRTLHVRLVHEGITPSKCGLCWKMFPTQEKLNLHSRLAHECTVANVKKEEEVGDVQLDMVKKEDVDIKIYGVKKEIVFDIPLVSVKEEEEVADIQMDGGKKENEVADIQLDGKTEEEKVADIQLDGGKEEEVLNDMQHDGKKEEDQVADIQMDGGKENEIADIEADRGMAEAVQSYMQHDGKTEELKERSLISQAASGTSTMSVDAVDNGWLQSSYRCRSMWMRSAVNIG